MLRRTIFIFGLITTGIFAQNVLSNNSLQPLPTTDRQPIPENNATATQARTLEALRQISSGTQKFSLELYKILAMSLPTWEGQDFIISPFSVWSLLMLVVEGALGKTYKELQDVLGLPNDLQYIRLGYKHIQNSLRVNTSTIELAVNQVMFSDKNRPVQPEYEEKMMRIYEADIAPIDFHDQSAYHYVNDYVKAKTNGKIEQIIEPSDLIDLQMVLISAIYFKGQWKVPFEKQYTREEPFYDEQGKNLGNVKMMYQKSAFGYIAHPELVANVLELPYGNENRLSMYVFLPVKGTSVATVIENIGKIGISKVINDVDANKIKYEDEEVEVFLPRFKISSDFTLNNVLESMGLLDVFDGNKANLLGISASAPYLSRVIHKAQIEVTEEGTIAAAVTGATLINKNFPSRFYANRPFAYVIVEKNTNLVLFCGQVANPAKNKF